MPYDYQSYAGTDIVATIHMPLLTDEAIVIGSLQTITYSIHREVYPVRSLGRIYPKGFTSGPGTIAGSLIFTVFHRSVVAALMTQLQSAYADAKTRTLSRTNTAKDTLLVKYMDRINYIKAGAPADMSAQQMQFYNWQTTESFHTTMNEMPPFDITLTFINEHGNQSTMVIEGVIIVDEGQVMSIEDILTEQTFSYMASGIQPMRHTGSWDFNENGGGFQNVKFNGNIYVPMDTLDSTVFALTLNETDIAMDVGGTVNLVASISPDIVPPVDVEWRILDTAVLGATDIKDFGTKATVSALAEGRTTITASLKGASASCTFQIGPIYPTSITIPAAGTVAVASTITLTPVFSEGATYLDVIWSSDDINIADVTQAGVVTGIQPGIAVITVMSDKFPQVRDTCTVTVEAV